MLRAVCRYDSEGSAGDGQTAVGAASDGHQDGGSDKDDASRHFEVGFDHENLTEGSAIQGGSALAS